MNDKRREQLMDEYEEAALKLLMDEYAEIDGERLLREYEEAEKEGTVSDVPKDLDRKCKQIIQDSFAEQNRQKRFRKTAQFLGKVAIFICVLLGIATTTVLSVDALKVPVLNYFLKYSDRYTAITLNEENEKINIELENIKECLNYYIPEEYELIAENVSNHNTVKLVYQNAENHNISLMVTSDLGQVFIDTENIEAQRITLNGEDALWVEKEGFQVLWSSSIKELSYNLYADALDEDIFWEIAYALAS